MGVIGIYRKQYFYGSRDVDDDDDDDDGNVSAMLSAILSRSVLVSSRVFSFIASILAEFQDQSPQPSETVTYVWIMCATVVVLDHAGCASEVPPPFGVGPQVHLL